ncbi:hypothetical protein LTR08_000651 [Meristemomyces frigidus]|nr:hypothetical protein LTR08_000651 [Meristemomyces frigidus]
MTLPPPVVYDPDKHKPILHQITQIHADCVLQDGMLANFLPDKKGRMDHDKLLNYWLNRSAQVESGSRDIILQFTDASETELAGVVSLDMPESESDPFRGLVEKLLVSPRFRKQGVARRVMAKLEEVARGKGRWGLALSTTIGSGAEMMYPKLGYTTYGVIPDYGIHPHTGELMDEMFFYKDLRKQDKNQSTIA